MNKLTITTGGFLLRNDDFDFLQNAYGEGFIAVAEALAKQSSGNLILSGCEINLVGQSGNFDEYDVTEGYIIFNYEILKCPAQQGVLVPSNQPLQFIVNSTFPITGTRQYANLQTHQAHEVRTCVVEEYNQQGIDVSFVPRLKDALSDIIISSKKTTNITIITHNGWSVAGVVSVQKEVSLKSLIINLICSQTFINAQASTQAGYKELACTIPLAFAPRQNFTFFTKNHSINGQGVLKIAPVIVDIETSGNVYVTKIDDGQNMSNVDIHVNYL
jgi:hypothetical protein